MTTDKEHLQWIFDRLVNVHKENANYDYMNRLQKIIETTKPVNVDLANVGTSLLNIKAIINKGENAERAFFNWFKENGIYWTQRGSNLENILVYETDIETIKDYWDELN